MRPRMNLPSESRLNHIPALRSRHGPGGRAAHTSPGTAHTAIPRSEPPEHSSEPTLGRSAAPGFVTTAPEKIPSPQCPWFCPLPSLLPSRVSSSSHTFLACKTAPVHWVQLLVFQIMQPEPFTAPKTTFPLPSTHSPLLSGCSCFPPASPWAHP